MTLTKAEINKRYRERHPERYLEQQKKYREANRKKLQKADEEYRKTPAGIKSVLKRKWKFRGLDMQYFEQAYKQYTEGTHCEICLVEYDGKNGSRRKNMEHCHDTGKFYGICCWHCNIHVIR